MRVGDRRGGYLVKEVMMISTILSITELRGAERKRWSSFLNIDLHRSKKSTFLQPKEVEEREPTHGQDFDDKR